MKKSLETLKEIASLAPMSPGVYKIKNGRGKTLYIGKAKILRSRVRSYFSGSSSLSPRISIMVGKARSIDFIVTASETDALILEDNLIKKEKPPYNVLLKDDKNYPYLKLTMDETYPRLVMTRRVEKDKGNYFGPYVSGKSVRSTMRLIHKIFPLRQSRDNLDNKPSRRPCLNYQMGRCLAPCAGKVEPDDYRELVQRVALFLRGKNGELLKKLHEKMMEASDGEQYESAGRCRDQIEAIKRLNERQTMTQTNMADQDIVASWESGGMAAIYLLQVRGGKVNAEKSFMFDMVDRKDRAEVLAAFIRQFYDEAMLPPPVVIVDGKPDGAEALVERLSLFRGSKVRLEMPIKGAKRKLVEMAGTNARLTLETDIHSLSARKRALTEIMETFCLAGEPKIIEAYDISNTSGFSTVGSCVVFRGGAPSKRDYRKYKVQQVKGPDDFAAMAEVLERRYKRLAEEKADFADLIVIDGGKGQVSAVIKRFEKINISPPPVVGIAKGSDRENVDTDEFYTPDGRVELSGSAKRLLQSARDEAHRFAVAYHRKTRGTEMMRSKLDDVPGVGPKRKKALLKAFGSVKRIRSASVEDIRGAINVSEKTAKIILDGL